MPVLDTGNRAAPHVKPVMLLVSPPRYGWRSIEELMRNRIPYAVGPRHKQSAAIVARIVATAIEARDPTAGFADQQRTSGVIPGKGSPEQDEIDRAPNEVGVDPPGAGNSGGDVGERAKVVGDVVAQIGGKKPGRDDAAKTGNRRNGLSR